MLMSVPAYNIASGHCAHWKSPASSEADGSLTCKQDAHGNAALRPQAICPRRSCHLNQRCGMIVTRGRQPYSDFILSHHHQRSAKPFAHEGNGVLMEYKAVLVCCEVVRLLTALAQRSCWRKHIAEAPNDRRYILHPVTWDQHICISQRKSEDSQPIDVLGTSH